MSNECRLAQLIGNLHLKEIDWYFRVYLMLGNNRELIEQSILFNNLSQKIHTIVNQFLSEEFKYVRSGFILAHYGRRGVTYSVWHWANWEGTWEYFCQAWYCYGRDVDNMEPLDRNEPILCHHEIDVVMQEALVFRDIAFRCQEHEEVACLYRAYGRDHEPVCY